MITRLPANVLVAVAVLAVVNAVAVVALTLTGHADTAAALGAVAVSVITLYVKQADTHSVTKDTNEKAAVLVNGGLEGTVRAIVGAELARFAIAQDKNGPTAGNFNPVDPAPVAVAPMIPPTDGHGNVVGG